MVAEKGHLGKGLLPVCSTVERIIDYVKSNSHRLVLLDRIAR